MRNCISKRRWDAYGHCLSTLSPTATRISVANNTEIVPIGWWFGKITVCGIGAYSWFEVFESHGAFNVILGKPWLHQLKAIHDYGNDQLRIPQGDSFTVIPNSLSTSTPDTPIQTVSDTVPEPAVEPPVVTETSTRNQFNREWARIHQLKASKSPWSETRWAVLDIEPMEDDEPEPRLISDQRTPNVDDPPEITNPLSEKDRRLE